MSKLAGTYEVTNKLYESEKLYREVIVLFAKTFGSEHEDTAQITFYFAGFLERQNKLDEAENLLREIVKVFK